MDKKFDIIVVGAVGIDTNIYLQGRDIDFNRETNFSNNIDYVGQAGGYSTRGFSQLGYKTGFIGYIGDDHNGELIKREFKKDKIKSLFFIDPAGTKRSINFMYQDGRRKNFYDAKLSMNVVPDLDECREFLENTSIIHVNIVNWARNILPIARDMGITISVDLQDIHSLDDDYIRDFVNYGDILFFSSVNFDSPEPAIKQFLQDKPDRIVVSGMGRRGCAVGYKEKIDYYRPVEMEKPVIDTNGAGDGLAVGFLSSYFLENNSLEEAAVKSQIAARYSCTRKADSRNLITKGKLQNYYDSLIMLPN